MEEGRRVHVQRHSASVSYGVPAHDAYSLRDSGHNGVTAQSAYSLIDSGHHGISPGDTFSGDLMRLDGVTAGTHTHS